MSRQAFDARFSDEEACARYLADQRWPKGFVCPSCGACKGWPLKRNRATWECSGCARQTSVTAGTVMHGSHLPLRTWFLAAHIITSHSNGMSALQLQAQLGLGSYKTAWLLLQKLRRAMVNPDRNPLKDLVEIDETEMPLRSRHDPVDRPKGGRSPVGKMFIVGAVELSADGQPRRIRMKHIPDGASKTLHAFIGQAVEPGAHIITDGWLGYENLPANTHEAKVVTGSKAHEILHWVHRVFSNLKRWAKGVVGQIRPLDGFVTPPTPRPQEAPSATLSRRIRVSLEPTATHTQRLRYTARDRCRSRARDISRFRRSARLKSVSHPKQTFCALKLCRKLIRPAPQAKTKSSVVSTCRSAGTKGISLAAGYETN